MRQRTITGPLILIIVGTLFLINNVWRDVPFWTYFVDYWPFILIGLGVIGLIEVLVGASRGMNPPPRPIATGWWWIIFPLAFFAWVSNTPGIHINGLNRRNITILGSGFDYDVNLSQPAAGVSRVVLDNIQGDLTIKGSDTTDVRLTGRKNVRAMNKRDAERANTNSPIRFDQQGDLLIVRALDGESGAAVSVSADLDIAVPKNVSVEMRGRSGDIEVQDIGGDVEIGAGRGDVRVTNVEKSVRVASRGGAIRVQNVRGSFDLEGRGGDVELSNMAGLVTISGEYSGTLEFRALAKPMHFTSSRSDFRVESVPGDITLDLGDLRMNNVVGPVHFQTTSRDVQATDVTNGLEIFLDHGDIQVRETKSPLPKMDVRSRNGDITLSLPDKAQFDLTGRTAQGSAENEFGSALTNREEGKGASITGKTGTGPQINASTERGSLTVRKN